MTRQLASLFLATTLAMLAACGGSDQPSGEASAPATAPATGAEAPEATAPEAPERTAAERLTALAGDQADATVNQMVATLPDDMTDMAMAARLDLAARGDHRSPGNAQRNVYRHPVETLTFFGLEADDVAVEVWPGGGTAWYTEVLAPVLRDQGRLVAAGWPLDSDQQWQVNAQKAFNEKMAARPDVYSGVEVIAYSGGDDALGEPASADMVLLSRHFHNFIANGITADVLRASRDVLKPGGVLAVVQHRAAEDDVDESEQRDGYVKESTVIAAAEAAGFQLDARSEINANPKDTRDHEMGVWTLPPTLRACQDLEGAALFECRSRYQAIGESDRMTLRFVKPAA